MLKLNVKQELEELDELQELFLMPHTPGQSRSILLNMAMKHVNIYHTLLTHYGDVIGGWAFPRETTNIKETK